MREEDVRKYYYDGLKKKRTRNRVDDYIRDTASEGVKPTAWEKGRGRGRDLYSPRPSASAEDRSPKNFSDKYRKTASKAAYKRKQSNKRWEDE
jgi:hypothetical protein